MSESKENALTISFPKNYYNTAQPLYGKRSITLTPGLTVFTGCNGSGKTTMLRILREKADRQKIPVFSYNNYTDGGNIGLDAALERGDAATARAGMLASEGETISILFANAVKSMGEFARKHESAEAIIATFDAMDSGASIDVIRWMREFFDRVLQLEKRDLYLVVTANSFEMARDADCILFPSLTKRRFKTYAAFEKAVFGSRKLLSLP